MASAYTPSTAVVNSTYATPVVKQVNLDSDTFILERDYRDAIITDWQDDDFLSFLEFPGEGRLAVASTFYHYEKPLLLREVYIAAASGTQTAASSAFTLTPASYTASGDGDRSPLKKDDIIHLPGDIYARIDIKSGTGTATIYTASRRAGTSDDIAAAIALAIANPTWGVPIPTNAHAEGTDMPDEGDYTPPTRFAGQFQTIKSYQAITGDASSHQRSVTENGTKYVWDSMLVDQLTRHRIKQKMAFMFSPEGNFTEAGLPVPLTSSLRGTTKVFGNRILYDNTLGFTLADLDVLINQIKRIAGVKKVHMFLGPTLRGQIESILESFGNNGGIIRNTWGGEEMGRKKMISVGFDGFERHNVTVMFQEFRLLTALTGQPWQTFDKEAYVVPADMATFNYTDRNGVQTISLNSVELRYKKQSDGKSRRFREVGRDMAITFTDKIEKGIQTQEGLEFSRRRMMWFVGPNV